MALSCTVISLVPFEIKEYKPGLIPPMYIIPASDGTNPSFLKVATATHFVYIDETRGNLQVRDPADIVARSVVDDFCSGQIGVDLESGPGIFWVPEEIESLEELIKNTESKIKLEKAKLRQRRWFINITKMADNDWKRYQQHNVVSDTQRHIGKLLGLNPEEHEWLKPLTLMGETTKPCPHCYSQIDKRASVCSVCGRDIEMKEELVKKG